ncbi:hypothetical protein AB5J62_33430 [Amycolatopsis sp. cg5]|uniref:hypothetical protein n=1 Tax=Amycolatopsis sp. cg5 TaxID=3238802 RepID=UPI003523E6D5
MMSTDKPMPADREPEAKQEQSAESDMAAQAEAMESLAMAGFRIVAQTGSDDSPELLTYVRSSGEYTDFVYIALYENAYSTAVRYPLIPAEPQNFEEASGEVPGEPLQHAEPGGIVAVIKAVLEWPRG